MVLWARLGSWARVCGWARVSLRARLSSVCSFVFEVKPLALNSRLQTKIPEVAVVGFSRLRWVGGLVLMGELVSICGLVLVGGLVWMRGLVLAGGIMWLAGSCGFVGSLG